MTSLILGIACIYIAFIIVRMPEERFREELDQLSGRKHAPGCYRMIRRLFLAVGILSAAITLLRFF